MTKIINIKETINKIQKEKDLNLFNLPVDILIRQLEKIDKINLKNSKIIVDNKLLDKNESYFSELIWKLWDVVNEIKIGELIFNKNSNPLVQEVNINNKSELLLFIVNNKDGDYIYRGEPQDYKMPLSSTFDRKKWTEGEFLDGFDKYVRNAKLFNNLWVNNHFNMLAHAQHYGFPTKMIDFTRKIGIALFFASADNIKEDFVVYKVPYEAFSKSTDIEDLNETTSETFILEPDFIDKRVEAQQGLFIYKPHNKSLLKSKESISYFFTGTKQMVKVKIKSELKSEIRSLLSEMNIDTFTMYNDYNSLVQTIIKGEK